MFIVIVFVASIAGIALVILGIVQPCSENMIVFAGEPGNMSFELIVVVILLLILIWFMNRQIESMTRLAYSGDMQASNDRMYVITFLLVNIT